MSEILSIGSVELIYLLYLFLVSMFFFKKVRSHFFEIVYLVGGLLSPYSISIIPYRQDYLDFYSLYTNSGVLNFFYFWDGLIIAPVYWLTLIVLFKNFSYLLALRDYFVKLVALVTLFSTLPLLYSYFFHSSEVDRIFIFFSPVKSFLMFLAFFVSVDRIASRIDLIYFIKRLSFLYFSYAVIISLLISYDVPDWMVWVKYGFKYKFLDQADQYFIFALILICVSVLYRNISFSVMTLVLFVMLLLSGGKGAIYYLAAAFFVYGFLVFKFGYALSYYSYFLFVAFTWAVAAVVGGLHLDVSSYTRYHQLVQLLRNYLEDPFLMIWGMGAQKAYYFFEEPILYDPGAYFSNEELSSYKIAFQMPFLDFLRTSGFVLGVGLAIIISINLQKFYLDKIKHIDDRRFKAFFLASAIYFVMFGFMAYPFWGGKQALSAALFAVIIKRKLDQLDQQLAKG
jgi:hypothetical protein